MFINKQNCSNCALEEATVRMRCPSQGTITEKALPLITTHFTFKAGGGRAKWARFSLEGRFTWKRASFEITCTWNKKHIELRLEITRQTMQVFLKRDKMGSQQLIPDSNFLSLCVTCHITLRLPVLHRISPYLPIPETWIKI